MSEQQKKMPNFLMIGAPKAGTTSLFQYLRLHPDVFLSDLKEPNFFALEHKNITYQGPGDKRGNRCRISNISDYEALFSEAEAGKAIGEASTFYLYSEDAAKNIFAHVPNMKMIAILRNPVDLAYSAYLHMKREGREPCSSFEEALAQEQTRIDQNWGPLWHLTRQGFYAQQLKRYYQYFPEEQIKIFLYEDWQKNQQGVLKDIMIFLGIDHTINLDTSKRFNESGVPKSLLIHQTLTKNNIIKRMLKPLLPKQLRRSMMASLTKKNLKQNNTVAMSETTRKMLQARFKDDIQALSVLTGKNLNHWLD